MRYGLLALAVGLAPCDAAGQSPTLEAAYVVLGAQGAIARAVLVNATQCPAITIDGAQQAMTVRALPDTTFPVLVCERPIPSSATSASIENSPLPLPRTALKSIIVFGDTGCRLKASKRKPKDRDDDDAGKFQACNVPSLWPFAQLAASVAAAKPDLVIHVGDYVYRESACPPRVRAARAVPTATTGRPGKPISSPPPRRRCGRRPGSWCAAITKSASAPAPAISACSIRRRPKLRLPKRRRPAPS